MIYKQPSFHRLSIVYLPSINLYYSYLHPIHLFKSFGSSSYEASKTAAVSMSSLRLYGESRVFVDFFSRVSMMVRV